MVSGFQKSAHDKEVVPPLCQHSRTDLRSLLLSPKRGEWVWLGKKMKPTQQPSGHCENWTILLALVAYAKECICGENLNEVSFT